jgi:hypothetical protein
MRRFGIFAVLLAGVTLAGCGEYSFAAYAPVPPPPVRVEAYGVAPGPGYIWANGYYGYRGTSYVWVPGGWRRPPRGHSIWEPGRWQQRGGRYYFTRGRWR